MKISELILLLEEILEDHGDIECFSFDGEGFQDVVDIIEGKVITLTQEGVEDLVSFSPLSAGDEMYMDHYYFGDEVEERHYTQAKNVLLFNMDLLS